MVMPNSRSHRLVYHHASADYRNQPLAILIEPVKHVLVYCLDVDLALLAGLDRPELLREHAGTHGGRPHTHRKVS